MAKVYDNSGSFSKNDRKEQPNHPDYKGKATVGGVAYWISGWIKEGDNGKWMSLSFQPKGEGSKPAPTKKAAVELPDDLIPF